MSWWRDQLNQSGDWKSLPNETRKLLIIRLQQFVLEFTRLGISQEELLELVKWTDITTVFDAMITMMQNTEGMNKYQALTYLKKVVLETQKFNKQKEPDWQKPEKEKKRTGRKVTAGYLERINPYNFKSRRRFCKVCKKPLREENRTGLCTLHQVGNE